MKIPYNKQGNVTKQTKLCTEQYYVYSKWVTKSLLVRYGLQGHPADDSGPCTGPVSSRKEQRVASILTLLRASKVTFQFRQASLLCSQPSG